MGGEKWKCLFEEIARLVTCYGQLQEVLVVVFVSLVKCEAHSSTVSKDIWSLWSNSGDRRNEKTHKNDDGGRVEEEGAEVGEWCAHVLGILRVSPWGMECLYLRVAWICTGEEQRISNFSILLLYYSRSCSSEVESTISGCPHLLAI